MIGVMCLARSLTAMPESLLRFVVLRKTALYRKWRDNLKLGHYSTIVKFAEMRARCFGMRSKNVTTEILILHGFGEHLLDIGGVDRSILRFEVGTFEADLVQQSFNNRVQTSRADIFGLLIHARGKVS